MDAPVASAELAGDSDPAGDRGAAGEPGSAGRKPLAVLDIDGVLADVRHRLPYVQSRPKDWDAFFGAISADPVLPDGVALAQSLAADHHVVYVTGRPEHTRSATTAWLGSQDLPSGRVFMRADDDFRPAREAKLRLMRKLARFGSVAVIVDDDPAVCATLRAAGWPVQQADWMPRPESLASAEEADGRT